MARPHPRRVPRRRAGDPGMGNRVRQVVRIGGTVLLGTIIGGLLVLCLMPLIQPLAFAAILAIACAPLMGPARWLTRGKQGLAALLITGVVAVIGVVPAAYLGSALTVEAGKAYEGLRGRVESGELKRRIDEAVASTRAILPPQMAKDATHRIEMVIGDVSTAGLRVVSLRLLAWLSAALENLPILALDLAVMMLSLFIFLRDGKDWIAGWNNAVPLPPAFRNLLESRVRDTTVAVVHGMFIAALAQSVLVGIGFKLFGVPLPVLFGTAGFFASLIPYIGVAVLWIPACFWLWITQDSLARAAGLFAYGIILVSSIDNIVKPIVIGEGARLPAYAMFIAIMGGIFAMGPLGLFLGPVVFAVAFAAISTYRDMVRATSRRKDAATARRS
ncbi:MAG: AI-2E family transporter [Candidatus Coatesbacteria bacterium]